METKDLLPVFVKSIERNVYEGYDALVPLEIQSVVQFNIHRKQLLEQLSYLLTTNKMALGSLFTKIPQYMGMYAMYVEEKSVCSISGDECERGRFVVLCQKIQVNSADPDSYSFFIRNDIFKYVRFYYFLTHFNFYVTRLVLDTTHNERWQDKRFIEDLYRKYTCAATVLMNLVIPLESI